MLTPTNISSRCRLRLLDKYGLETVNACVAEIYDHAERVARVAIRRMPAGTWSADDFLDDNGVQRVIPVPVHVSVTVDPVAAEITFDTPAPRRGRSDRPTPPDRDDFNFALDG